MSKKTKPPNDVQRLNPVARHAHKVNRSLAFQDRTRYRRVGKHKGVEPFANFSDLLQVSLRKVLQDPFRIYGNL